MLLRVVASAMMLLIGCRSGVYTAKTLPPAYQAPALPTSTELNLEQMGGVAVDSSQIAVGDLVSITVFSGIGDEKPSPLPARVAEDGTVTVPLIGAVQVGGTEPVIAEQRIATAAIQRGIYRQPYITLTVTEHAVNRVTVLGAVGQPGTVALQRGSSDLASALAAAGGLTQDAGTRVQILHRGNRSLAENSPGDSSANASKDVKLASYNKPTESASEPPIFPAPPNELHSNQSPDLQMSEVDLAQTGAALPASRELEDGDVVMVQPREKRFIHVTGLVQKPSEIELTRDKDLRLLDAIAMAGGASSYVADKVVVIRQLPNMPSPVVIKVSMSAAKHDGNENLRLAAGDLVSVEVTPATVVVDTIGKFFRIGFGLSSTFATF
ncbi:MAG TPA: SLBB domain-containing protein [Lacipirellulaceae bacterium]|nr:SLBB domain-containing protein [Lacipirellulaceae bacterium]